MSFRVWVVLVCLMSAASATEKNVEVGLGVDSDNAEGRGNSADVSWTVAPHQKLSLSRQKSRSTYDYLSPCTKQYATALLLAHASTRPIRDALALFPEQTIDTTSQNTSVAYRYSGETWGAGIANSRYDGGDGFEMNETSFSVDWQGESWDVGVDASQRTTEFAIESQRFSGTLQNPQCLSSFYSDSISSQGAGLTLGYTFDNGWRLYGAATAYNSDFTLPVNVNFETLLLRTVNAGSLSTALTKNRRSVGVQIPFDELWLSVEAGHENSMIDESTTKFWSVWLVWSLNDNWDIELSANSSSLDLGPNAESSDADKLRSFGMGARWYW